MTAMTGSATMSMHTAPQRSTHDLYAKYRVGRSLLSMRSWSPSAPDAVRRLDLDFSLSSGRTA
jgi:hypothetical protein